jgi:hypothetical protein
MKQTWNDFNSMSGPHFEGCLIRAFDAALARGDDDILLEHPMTLPDMNQVVNGAPALQALNELSANLSNNERVAAIAVRYGISEERARGIGIGLEIASMAFTGYIQGMNEFTVRQELKEQAQVQQATIEQ